MKHVAWSHLPLGELTENYDSMRIPVKGIDRVKGPYPYYGASGVIDWIDDYIFDGEYLLVAEDGENLKSRKTPIAFMANGKFWVNNHAHIVRGNDKADTRFLMYTLQRMDIKPYLTGTTMPKLTQNNLNRIPVLTPPLPTQRRIAEILGRLDDKIEVNRRINRTLEALAQALFKHHFVEFGPYQDDEFGESALGSIPRGWGVGTLGDIARNVRNGIDPTALEPETPYIGLADMPQGSITLDTWGAAGDSVSGKSVMKKGQFLFGKLRPYFKKVGIVPVDGVCSTDILVIEPKDEAFYGVVFCQLFDQSFVDYTTAVSAGTKMPRVSWEMMAQYKIPLPDPTTVQPFSQTIKRYAEIIIHNIIENRKLAEVRDYLLPKLLSGEIEL